MNDRMFADLGEVKEAVRESISLVDYVSKYVELDRRGANYFGLCPFHSEKTPSFNVTPNPRKSEVAMFSCFGCGVSGDLFEFAKAFHHVTFVEAIQIIAEISGFNLEPFYREQTPEEKFKSMMSDHATGVADWCHEKLVTTPTKLLFFQERGIGIETLREFKIGYCPSIAEMERDFGAAVLDYIDPHPQNRSAVFNNNIVYPQFAANGRVWGFYARTEGTPKYRATSGDSPLFQGKGRFYGLHLAKKIARVTKHPFVIVEGFNDALAVHQAKLPGIAICGALLSTDQIQALSDNFIRECVVVLDGDQAGYDGMVTIAKDAYKVQGTHFKFARITGDPDEFIANIGADAFRQVLKESLCAIEFIVTTNYSLNDTSPTAQLDFLHRISSSLLDYPRMSYNRELGVNAVARLLGMQPEAVIDFLEQFSEINVPVNLRGEQVVLAEFCRNPEAWSLYPEIKGSDFFFLRYRKTFELALEMYKDGATIDADSLSMEAERRGAGKYVLETIEQLRTLDTTQAAAYTSLLREKADRREALAMTQKAVAYFNDPTCSASETLNMVAEDANRILMGHKSSQLITSVVGAQQAKAEMVAKMTGGTSAIGLDLGPNWESFMSWINYLQQGRVHIIAALSGVGKSLIGINWAHRLSMAPDGLRVPGLFASLEMTPVENINRLCSIESGVPNRIIERGCFQTADQQEMVKDALETYAASRIFFMDGTIQSIAIRDIAIQARTLIQKDALRYIMIDYIQLLNLSGYGDRMSQREKYDQVSQEVKELAGSLKVPVIIMAQLNRTAYESEVGTGEMMGSSYKIYQDCHVCYTVNQRKDALFGYVDKARSGQKNVGCTLSFDSNPDSSTLLIREVGFGK